MFKWFVSWAAGFYPNTVFYGKTWKAEIAGAMTEHIGGDRREWMAHAAQVITGAVGDMLQPGQSAKVEISGLVFRDRKLGSYTVTITKNKN